MTSGKITSAHIGRTVYLSNSAITCQEWVIADVNHDGTSGTVDLFGRYILNNKDFSIQYNTVYSSVYKGSNLDNYLESTVYNGFAAEVKNALNNMNVATRDEIIQRHVVAPSVTELGLSKGNSDLIIIDKGNIYPLFSPACNPNPKAGFTYSDGSTNYNYYWTRGETKNPYTGGYEENDIPVSNLSGTGRCYTINPMNKSSIVARIRFAKA